MRNRKIDRITKVTYQATTLPNGNIRTESTAWMNDGKVPVEMKKSISEYAPKEWGLVFRSEIKWARKDITIEVTLDGKPFRFPV